MSNVLSSNMVPQGNGNCIYQFFPLTFGFHSVDRECLRVVPRTPAPESIEPQRLTFLLFPWPGGRGGEESELLVPGIGSPTHSFCGFGFVELKHRPVRSLAADFSCPRPAGCPSRASCSVQTGSSVVGKRAGPPHSWAAQV